jgi:Pyruvate/2-oxoacid:ferredoxin oxidoreductase gamma subunit
MAANIILLAATNSIGRLVSRTSLEESIKSTVPSRFVELNLHALQIGFDLAEHPR